jgi:outer membrane protein assembly factor BamB
LLWYRSLVKDYPTVANQVGMASSPALAGDTLCVQMENVGESFVVGIDTKTGQNRWKHDRTRDINWTSPLVLNDNGKQTVIFQSAKAVTALDPETGKPRWEMAVDGASTIPSPSPGDGVVYIPGSELLAVRPREDGITPDILWKSTKLRSSYSSPVHYQGKLYVLNDTGVTCVDAGSGQEIWKQRVTGPFSASPVIADGKLYAVNEKGATMVVQLGEQPKVLATNALDDTILATPAISGGAIFMRSDGYLYCIGAKK